MVVTPDTILLRCPSQNLSYRHNVLEGVRLQLLAWSLPLSDFQPLLHLPRYTALSGKE
jgi:hypothetical protein